MLHGVDLLAVRFLLVPAEQGSPLFAYYYCVRRDGSAI